MKKIAVILLAVQSLNALADQAPSDATGPGVTYTQRVMGRVVGVGAPVTKQVPTGQTCYTPQVQPQQSGSAFNIGTIIGTVAGAVVGSRIGAGTGRDVAIAAGAATGGAVGNDYYQNSASGQGSRCEATYEQHLVGYSYIAQYQDIQVQGFMNRQPRIGEEVSLIVRSTFFAAN
jgi:uncharacterized protein YcfJ